MEGNIAQIFCSVRRTAEAARAYQCQIPFHTLLLAFRRKQLSSKTLKHWEQVPALLECRKEAKEWTKVLSRDYLPGMVVSVKQWCNSC